MGMLVHADDDTCMSLAIRLVSQSILVIENISALFCQSSYLLQESKLV